MPDQWIRVQPGVSAGVTVDPYFEWARRTEFRYFFAGENRKWFPVAIQVRKPQTAQQFARGDWHRPPDWENWLRVSSLFADPPPDLRGITHCAATVTREFFSRLESDPGLRAMVQRVGLGLPAMTLGADIHPQLQPLGGRAKPKTVVTGVIDDGLAFAHERFRGADHKTRIRYFWDQDASLGTMDDLDGRELIKETIGATLGIDDHMATNAYGGMVDEDAVYRVTRHVDHSRTGHKSAAWRAAHGTHVMDLACGYAPVSAPDRRPIIGVQLPMATTADTSGGTLEPQAILGLDYILNRAHRIGPNLPVVVNLSYGIIAGPHDGTSILETAIDELIDMRKAPLAVVLPSGNSYLARCHAQFSLQKKSDRQPLHWRVLPDDATPSFLEIWLPHVAGPGPGPKVAIQVVPPWGDASGWVNESESWTWQPGGNVLCEVAYLSAAETGTRPRILVSLAPTSTLDPVEDVAPSGMWLIHVMNAGPLVDIDAWIQRDDTPYGYPRRGRQSYFDDPSYQRFDNAGREVDVDSAISYVKREGSINAIATGGKSIVIGGFRRSDMAAAKYSAGGPIVLRPGGVPAPRAGPDPDAMAVSEDSVACRGVLAAGARSGAAVAMNGTSVAAPQIARWLAGEARASRPITRAAVRSEATQQETPPPPRPAMPPATRSGDGRIALQPIKPVPPIERFEP